MLRCWKSRIFLSVLLSLCGVGSAVAQSAAAPLRHFEIPSQSLHLALGQFARQSGMQVSVDAPTVDGLMSWPLSGEFTVDQALNTLLTGTGLQWYLSDDATVVLQSTAVDGMTLLPKLKVESGVDIAAEDAPYRAAESSSVITSEQIARFRGTSVGDIFQGTPGVLVGENRNSGGLDINIRGMQGQSRVPVLIDGARQETTVYRGYAGVASRSYVDPDLIGGIDISKGPVMDADGAGATGGVVSMRTLSVDDIITTDKDWGLRLRGSLMSNSSRPPSAGTAAGVNGTGMVYRVDCASPGLCEGEHALPESFGEPSGMDRPGLLDFRSWAGSLALAKRFETVDVVIAYAQRDQGNYYTGKDGPIPDVELQYRELPFYTEVTALREGISRFRGEERVVNSNNKSKSLLLKSDIYLPDDQLWTLSYQRYDSEYGELMPSQLIWLEKIRQTESSTVTADTYTSRYQWSPGNRDWLNLRANLWHTHTRSLNRSYSEDIYESFNSPEPKAETYDRYGLDLSNEMTWQGWGEHLLSYGVSAQWEDIDTPIPAEDLENPLANAAFGRIGERDELAAFLNWQWQPWEELTLNSGIRYLRVETEDHKPIVPQGEMQCVYDATGECVEEVYMESIYCVDRDGDGECDPISYRTRNSGSAPVFSVSWEPWLNGVQFYLRHAEALRMPSLFEATQGWSVKPALDVALRPEHATNREAGVNVLRRDVLFEADRLALKLARFRNLTEDYLTRTSPNVWEEGNEMFVMRNIDSVELHGTELSVEYDQGRFYGSVAGTKYDHIEVCHYGSYRRERCNDYGVANSYFNNMIPPEWHATVTLGARLFKKRLDTGLRLTYMGQRTPTPPFNDDTARGFNSPVPWHAYRLVDLYASWQHSEQLSVDFNIDNATDQYYLDALSLGMVPAPGRTARLSLTWSF